VLDFDPLEQRMTLEMQAFMWRDGDLVAEDEHLLTLTLYFKDEIVLMLERAGFVDVREPDLGMDVPLRLAVGTRA
jgi:hypothetical protein